jgi:type I restriction enzyme M protein
VRWAFGVPPKGNADFPRVQRFIRHLASQGQASLVLANGSMSSNLSREGDVRPSGRKSSPGRTPLFNGN